MKWRHSPLTANWIQNALAGLDMASRAWSLRWPIKQEIQMIRLPPGGPPRLWVLNVNLLFVFVVKMSRSPETQSACCCRQVTGQREGGKKTELLILWMFCRIWHLAFASCVTLAARRYEVSNYWRWNCNGYGPLRLNDLFKAARCCDLIFCGWDGKFL